MYAVILRLLFSHVIAKAKAANYVCLLLLVPALAQFCFFSAAWLTSTLYILYILTFEREKQQLHSKRAYYFQGGPISGRLQYVLENEITRHCQFQQARPTSGCLVEGRGLKHWTVDRKGPGTCSRDLLLFQVHSAHSKKLSRGFIFVSFGGDINHQVLGNPLKLA